MRPPALIVSRHPLVVAKLVLYHSRKLSWVLFQDHPWLGISHPSLSFILDPEATGKFSLSVGLQLRFLERWSICSI